MHSCSNSKPVTDPVINKEILFKNEWRLIELSGGKKMSVDSKKAIIVFTEGQPNKITGHTGCNKLSGIFEIPAGAPYNISFSPIATTKMACLNKEDNLVDARFSGVFGGITRWYIYDGDVLVLFSNGSKMATFLRKPTDSAKHSPLNGTWELNYISGPKIAFDGLFPNKKPTIVFNFPKEEAYGSGSCNGYGVKVKTDGNKINFSDTQSTLLACEGNGESVYFKTLEIVTSYKIDDNTLTMIMGDIAVMRFIRK